MKPVDRILAALPGTVYSIGDAAGINKVTTGKYLSALVKVDLVHVPFTIVDRSTIKANKWYVAGRNPKKTQNAIS